MEDETSKCVNCGESLEPYEGVFVVGKEQMFLCHVCGSSFPVDYAKKLAEFERIRDERACESTQASQS